MTLTFITNYMTPHQKPLCDELYKQLGDDFHFIAVEKMDEERVKMGWGEDMDEAPYAFFNDDDYDRSNRLMRESDVVICGSIHQLYIEERLSLHKPTFRYFERLYKKGRLYGLNPSSLSRKKKEHAAYKNDPVYLLCAGAYTAGDFALSGSYPGKKYRFGYFPRTIEFKDGELKDLKNNCVPEILWSGRMLDWKHPGAAVFTAIHLRKNGIPFHMTIIGDGECRKNVELTIQEHNLYEDIEIKDFMKPEEVREIMARSDIYLMTSDTNEGWGAVVNEAMNAGCAVVASNAAGSVPYLIKHEENGLIYKSGDFKQLGYFTAKLCLDKALREKLGNAAENTIRSLWNEKETAKRLINTCENLLKDNGSGNIFLYEDGPMSKAPEL